jgi:hypothetical protein
LNSFLRQPDAHLAYPTFHCYQEEIRWYFHGLKPEEPAATA